MSGVTIFGVSGRANRFEQSKGVNVDEYHHMQSLPQDFFCHIRGREGLFKKKKKKKKKKGRKEEKN